MTILVFFYYFCPINHPQEGNMQDSSITLSILIPTYNQVCVALVRSLQAQAEQESDLVYEILVGDDGSTDPAVLEANEAINTLPHCRYIIRGVNTGRSAIRNYLAKEAHYDLLLFIDSHMSVVSNDYIARYLRCRNHDLVYGGYNITKSSVSAKNNLRLAYELSCISQQQAEERALSPHARFHTCNFLVRREVMLRYPFDERFKHYGYEDVLFGKTLKEAGINIFHIDNPLGFNHFESNERFLQKTDEGLQTLWDFHDELRGYSRLLTLVERLKRWHLAWLPRMFFHMTGNTLRRHLTGNHPTLLAFKAYRLGKMCELARGDLHSNS